jgi:hypothetical protein
MPNERLIPGVLLGVIFALCVGQMDQSLQLPWWHIVLYASGCIFGMYGAGLLLAWGINRDNGHGTGLSLVPGGTVLVLVALFGFFASLGMISTFPASSNPTTVVFVVVVGESSLLVLVRTIQTHLT